MTNKKTKNSLFYKNAGTKYALSKYKRKQQHKELVQEGIYRIEHMKFEFDNLLVTPKTRNIFYGVLFWSQKIVILCHT